jgi:hypothetical protein
VTTLSNEFLIYGYFLSLSIPLFEIPAGIKFHRPLYIGQDSNGIGCSFHIIPRMQVVKGVFAGGEKVYSQVAKKHSGNWSWLMIRAGLAARSLRLQVYPIIPQKGPPF